MNRNIGMLFTFAAGVVVGVLATRKVVETKYRNIADDEIASVVDRFTNRQDEVQESDDIAVAEEAPVSVCNTAPKNSVSDYRGVVERVGYDQISAEKSKPKSGKRKKKVEPVEELSQERPGIYIITPDEFNTLDDYTDKTFYYSSDGYVLDSEYTILEAYEIECTIGHDPFGNFGEYDDQTVYVRNTNNKTDYEILLSMKTAEEITED